MIRDQLHGRHCRAGRCGLSSMVRMSRCALWRSALSLWAVPAVFLHVRWMPE